MVVRHVELTFDHANERSGSNASPRHFDWSPNLEFFPFNELRQALSVNNLAALGDYFRRKLSVLFRCEGRLLWNNFELWA